MRCLILMLILLPLAAGASTVNIFADKAVYFPDNHSSFAGFTAEAEVSCEGEAAQLYFDTKAPDTCYICGVYKNLQDAERRQSRITAEIDSIEKAGAAVSSDIQSTKTLNTIKKYIFEQNLRRADLAREAQDIAVRMQRFRNTIKDAGTSERPAYVDSDICKDKKISTDGVAYDTLNVLDITAEKPTAQLNLYLTNKSGIDITADTAFLIMKRSRENLRIPEFRSWILRPISKSRPVANYRMAETAAPVNLKSETKKKSINKEDSFIYKIDGLELPSTGKKQKLTLEEKPVEITDRLVVYPYQDETVYREISFKAPFEDAGGSWRFVSEREVFSDIYPVYDEGRLRLAAGADRSIKVKREIIESDRQDKGLFNSSDKIRSGYKVTISNLSAVAKTINIIERLPVSKDESIVVQDILVNGKAYTSDDKKGMLSQKTELEAGGTKTLTVTFTVVKDKETDINL